jgi:hypothetical protein
MNIKANYQGIFLINFYWISLIHSSNVSEHFILQKIQVLNLLDFVILDINS